MELATRLVPELVAALPRQLATAHEPDVLAGRGMQRKRLCRTFSDCTTAPRNGMVSGCYPLDHHYKKSPQMVRLAAVKKAANLAKGVPFATPVFDGAKEEEIRAMLKLAYPDDIAAKKGLTATRTQAFGARLDGLVVARKRIVVQEDPALSVR